jgi:hypothetical protein
MEISDFHEKVLRNRNSKKGFKELVKTISIHVYFVLRNHYKMDDDERGEFFCIFYPKIPGLISRYEYYGIPFDGYLNNSIRWSIKAYRSSKSKYRSIQKAYYTEPFFLVSQENNFTELEKIPLSISESARKALRLEDNDKYLSETVKQRILYIYLIEANFIDERLKEGIIRITGYKKKWIDLCTEELKLRVQKRLDRIRIIRDRRNSAFFKFHLLQEKISFAEDENEKLELKEEISKLKQKIYKMNMTISKAPTRPTHKDIAEILGIPRGSIDSGIHYIKSSFKEIDKKSA